MSLPSQSSSDSAVVSPEDIASLIRDKYDGDKTEDLTEDLKRLASGEPLAYVIGWIPFLGLRISLDSHPLIPRPETEWWTEKLIAHLQTRFESQSGSDESPTFSLLDLCAGSGAIGLAILKRFPNARVSFGELMPEHVALIKKNLEANGLDASRVDIRESDLFNAFYSEDRFDVMATNPPYIPATRELETSVSEFEPNEALFSGQDGLEIIQKILAGAKDHLLPEGEIWMECDVENIEEAQKIAGASGARSSSIHEDQYGRPRILVAHF